MREAEVSRSGLTLTQSVAFAAAYLVLAAVGRSTVLPGGSVSLVWPASGVAVLWLLAEHPRRQVRVLAPLAGGLAVVLALTSAPSPLVVAASLSVVVQTWLIVALLRRWCPELLGAGGRESVHHPRTLALGTSIVLGSCALGAALSAIGLWASDLDPGPADALLVWGRQVAGVLVVGSVGHLGWEWVTRRRRVRARGGGRGELALLWGLSALAVATLFTQSLPLVFLVVPISVWCASRFATFVAAVHATVIGTAALVLTVRGEGPFARVGDPYTAAMVTQVFLLALLLTALAVGTLSDRIDDLVRRLRDAGERAEAQAELLTGMTETMVEGLIVLDGDGVVLQYTPGSTELARQVRAGEDEAAIDALVNALESATAEGHVGPEGRRAELGPGDLVVPLADGRELILAVTARPLTATSSRGRPGTLLVLRDVTAHRLGFRPLVDFAATAAHDLRTPLTAMSAWLSLIADEPEVTQAPHLREPIERVGHAVVRMGTLIDEMLEHATAEGGVFEPERVELGGDDGVLAHVLDMTGLTPIGVSVPDVPPVFADPAAVRQLFANLLGNAKKFTAPGTDPQVEITGMEQEGRVVVEVRDHGIGVPEADRQHIFERFSRSGSVRTAYAGNGLGLAMCRAIVERHGGRIECVAPDFGPGVVFRLDLPAA